MTASGPGRAPTPEDAAEALVVFKSAFMSARYCTEGWNGVLAGVPSDQPP